MPGEAADGSIGVELDAIDPVAVRPLVFVILGVDPLPSSALNRRDALGIGGRAPPVNVELEAGPATSYCGSLRCARSPVVNEVARLAFQQRNLS
jgi:hypothetical protein